MIFIKKEVVLGLTTLAICSSVVNAIGFSNTVNPAFEGELIHKNNTEMIGINKKIDDLIVESRKKLEQMKIEEQKKIKQMKIETKSKELIEEKKAKQKQLAKKQEDDIEWITFELTFYTNLASENSKYGGITCTGAKLRDGMVANNVLPLGTEIRLKGYGTVTVSDRGGKNFNKMHRLDVYVPRQDGESNSEYYKRVNNMGRVKVKGYIKK